MFKKITLASTLFFIFTLTAFSQKKPFLPEDLKNEKLIILELTGVVWPEGVEPKDYKEKRLKRWYNQRNREIPRANKNLRESAKDYPFQYVIAKRSEIPKYQAEGYKYVLDCTYFKCIDKGESLYGGKYENIFLTNTMSIEELNSENTYPLYEFTAKHIYEPWVYLALINRDIKKYFKKSK